MKLKIEAIKVTRGLLANPRALSRVIENTLSAAALGVKADFGVTTQTWSKRPSFTIEKRTGERIVRTRDEIYGYVDHGTRPHLIRARGGRSLAFRTGYRAKTRPRSISSGGGGASGNWAHAKVVRHPGTKAREFSETIAKKWQAELPTLMQRSIDSAIE